MNDENEILDTEKEAKRKPEPTAEFDNYESVQIYMKELGKYPLLTAEQEVEIAKRIAEGDKSAKDELFKANMRLVVSIARRYRSCGMALSDLIQEGNIGLMKAIDKFDYTKGFKFATYATWWIRQGITRAIADGMRTIRIPVHMTENINKLSRATRKLEQALGRAPTSEELAAELDLPVKQVDSLLKISQNTVSIDLPVGEDGDSRLADFLEDEKSKTPQEYAESGSLHEQLEEVLGTLSPREEMVLRLRYGFIDGKSHTLEEVGAAFGVTRERVRQIEIKALRKLRHPSRSKLIKEFK